MSPIRPTPSRAPSIGRETAAVLVAAFALLLILRGAVLFDPPYWDALLGVFPQADWQARNGFDPLRLLREEPRYIDGGACVYPFSVVPPFVALLQRASLDAPSRFAILHLLTFACTAIACGALFRLARPYGRSVAWLATAAFLAQPGTQALACQIGLEMPLVASAACGVTALAERRWGASFIASTAALLVKPTGIVVAVTALAFFIARVVAPRRAGTHAPRERSWALAHAGLGLLFVAEIALLHAFEREPAGAGLFGGFVLLFTKRLLIVPEFALSLAALVVALIIAWARRDRAAPIPLAILSPALFLVAYLGLLAQWENVLPRYFVAAYPAVFALIAAALVRFAPRGGAAPVLGAIALFGLLGARGQFQPDRGGPFALPGESTPLAANDGWLLERSLRFRDGLALDREIARFASSREGTVFVAPWPIQHALVEPSFGYVDRPVPCASAETSVAWSRIEQPTLAGLRPTDREVLWILTPNDFIGDASKPRVGDIVVARFAVGAQRAIVVRRASFP